MSSVVIVPSPPPGGSTQTAIQGGTATIDVDGTSIAGDGSGADPLHTVADGTAVLADGVTIAGDGVAGAPLSVLPAGLADQVPVLADGVTIVGNGTTAGGALVALASAGTTIYFNVKAYGAKGDSVTNDTVAIRAANTAAAAIGGGTVYVPDATGGLGYIVSQNGSSQRCIDISTGVTFLGQSRQSAGLYMASGTTASESVRVFYVDGSSTNTGIQDLYVDGNTSGNPDASLQSDGVFIDLSAEFCTLTNVEVRNCSGSAIVPHQDTSDVLIQGCYIHGCTWIGIDLGDAGGQARITVRDTRITGNAGGLHIETAVACSEITFDNCYADAETGAAACQVAGGATTSEWATDITVSSCTFVGFVQTTQASNVTWLDCTVTNADTATGQPPNEFCAYRVYGQGYNIKAIGCTFIQQAAGTSPQAVLLAGDGNNNMFEVYLIECDIEAQGNTDGVYIQQIASVYIHGGNIRGNASITGTHYGINVNAKVAPNVGEVHVIGARVVDFPIGLGCQSASSSLHINSIQVCDTTFEASALAMTAGMSLDADGHHAVQQATCIGNDLIGLSTMFATYPNVPMLIGGNRGGVEYWSVATSPAGSLVAPIGSQAAERDNGTTWINTTGGSSGWHSINVT